MMYISGNRRRGGMIEAIMGNNSSTSVKTILGAVQGASWKWLWGNKRLIEFYVLRTFAVKKMMEAMMQIRRNQLSKETPWSSSCKKRRRGVGDSVRGVGGYSVSSESVKTIKRASNRGGIVQWKLLWGEQKINRVYCLRAPAHSRLLGKTQSKK